MNGSGHQAAGGHTARRALAAIAPLPALTVALVTILIVAVGATAAVGPATARAAAPASGAAAPILRIGARGADVRALQKTLARLTYLPASGVDGAFGRQTWHAVVAFQGWSGLVRDGVVGPRTRAALARAHRPVPWSTRPGLEVHVRAQVLLLVAGGRVARAVHVSSGAHGTTPLGHFAITSRQRMSWSVRFRVWMPYAQYFHDGYALHEYPQVPAYPASHGCVRIPAGEAAAVWRFGRVGMRLWTRG